MDSARKRLNRNVILAMKAANLAAGISVLVQQSQEPQAPASMKGILTSQTAPQLIDLLRQLGGQIRQLAVALLAIKPFPEPGSAERREISEMQGHLHRLIEFLKSVLVCAGFAKQAAFLDTRRLLALRRPKIGTILFESRRKEDLRNDERRALQTAEKQLQQTLARLADITPEMLLMAHLGMAAMAGFPKRPKTPQQARRKKRRRRRSNPFAPTASLRPARDEEED